MGRINLVKGRLPSMQHTTSTSNHDWQIRAMVLRGKIESNIILHYFEIPSDR